VAAAGGDDLSSGERSIRRNRTAGGPFQNWALEWTPRSWEWSLAMTFKTLVLASVATMALGVSVGFAETQNGTSREFDQIGPDGMPTTSEDKAHKERTPRDMAP